MAGISNLSLTAAILNSNGHTCDGRCANDRNSIPNFDKLILEPHNQILSNVNSAERIGQSESITVTTPIIINVPIVFHIMFNTNASLATMTTHLTNNVIKAINADFACCQLNFNTTHNDLIRQIFARYPNKMNLYLSQINRLLTNNSLIKWNFTLKSVIFKTNNTIGITSLDSNNNKIKNLSPAVDPTKNLNIWIAPSNQGILGISVFPWFNRLADGLYNTTFDPAQSKYHGILIASSALGPNFSSNFPYATYKTFAHEIGHYFGLLHTFDNTTGSNPLINQIDANPDYSSASNEDTTGDLIIDTSYQFDATTRLVTYTNASTSLHMFNIFTNYNNYQPMFMDLMDYSYDSQLFYFSKDQHQKMVFFIKRYYSGLL
jgi:hypothetical protein